MIRHCFNVSAVRPICKLKYRVLNSSERFTLFDLLKLPVGFGLPLNLVRDLFYKLNITICQEEYSLSTSALEADLILIIIFTIAPNFIEKLTRD